jgi:hypothetical protein
MLLATGVDRIVGRALDGLAPSREECVYLLRIPSDALEATVLTAVADTVSRRRFGQEAMFLGVEYGCFQHAAMRRVFVPGMPLSGRGQIPNGGSPRSWRSLPSPR